MTVAALEDLGTVQHLAYVLQLTLGAVFGLSAIPKLRAPSTFADTVAEYEVVGPRLARLAAPAVIAVECLLAVCLLTGALVEPALALAGLVLVGFAAVTALNLRRERDVPCGCFGDAAERVSVRGLVRVGLLLLALLALAAALAVGEANAITAGDLADDGWSALRYLVSIGGTTAAVMLAAALALRARELRPVLRYLRPPQSRPPVAPRSERSSA